MQTIIVAVGVVTWSENSSELKGENQPKEKLATNTSNLAEYIIILLTEILLWYFINHRTN
jgi:hypothetical protein